MWYRKNVGGWERAARLIGGGLMLICGVDRARARNGCIAPSARGLRRARALSDRQSADAVWQPRRRPSPGRPEATFCLFTQSPCQHSRRVKEVLKFPAAWLS